MKSAALSRDGRYFAAATPRNDLVVHDLDHESEQVFTEHTDEINHIRFGGDDHLLISADRDNRVVLRPRTATGYAKPLLSVEVDA